MIRLSRRDNLPADGPPVTVETSVIEDTMPTHVHNFIELAVVTSGRAAHRCRMGTTPVLTGNVIVMGPGEWHEYTDADELVVRNVYIGSELFGRELAWTRQLPGASGMLWPPVARTSSATRKLELNERAQTRVQCALDGLEGDGCMSGEHVLSRMGNLLLLLAELAQTSRFGVTSVPDAVLRVVERIEADLSYPWALADLAAVAGVSTSKLTRMFRESLGVSPLAALATLRSERVASLLIETDLPIGEIGRRVGWPDPAYLSRRFSALMGVSPNRYRDTADRHAR